MFGINHETAPAHKVIADITGMPGRIKKIHDWLITPERSFGLKPWKVLLFVVFIIIYTIALAWFY